MPSQVINFGSINIDHIYRVAHFVEPGETLASESLHTVLGGKGANQSVALARAGIRVDHVGNISQQDDWAINQMQEAGVNTKHLGLSVAASGHAIIQVDDRGENAIVLHGGANQACKLEQLKGAIEDSPAADYLLLQNECNLLAEAIELANQHNLKIALNPAPMTADIKQLPLEKINVLIVNQGEGQALSGESDTSEMLRVLTQRLPNTLLVLTLGADGALMSHHGELFEQAATATTVIDTTAAGDTFVGYLLAGIIERLAPQDNLARACTAAALAVTKAGAIPSIPNCAEVNAACTK